VAIPDAEISAVRCFVVWSYFVRYTAPTYMWEFGDKVCGGS